MSRRADGPTEPESVDASPVPTSSAVAVDEIDDIGLSAASPHAGKSHIDERPPTRGNGRSRVVAYALLPAMALLITSAAGYLKWQEAMLREDLAAHPQSVQAAVDGTVALLSYRPETVEEQLTAARGLLTGEFQDSYTSLTNDVVIPGAKEKQISAIASVPAAASVSATPEEAVVLLFVNQTVQVGPDAPTDTASSVRVTLEKDGDRWLISKFDPV